MFMTKMVSALPQPAASACSLQLTACCTLQLASCNANRKDAKESLQMELQMREPRCECICLSPPSLPSPPLSLSHLPSSSCPSLSVQFGAVRQAASHQLNIVMRFTLTQPSPPFPLPSHSPRTPSCVANIQYVFQLAFHHLLSSSFKSLEL